MEVINKLMAIIMLPLSVLIILEAMDIFSIESPFDKLLIASILMIVLQLLSIIFASTNQEGLTLVNYLTLIIFSLPAIAYVLTLFFALPFENHIPIILGVMMLAEAIYALH